MKKSTLRNIIREVIQEEITGRSNINSGPFLSTGFKKVVKEVQLTPQTQALEKLLKTHDWFYSYSDDPKVYDNGKSEENAIYAAMKKVPQEDAQKLYMKYVPPQYKNTWPYIRKIVYK